MRHLAPFSRPLILPSILALALVAGPVLATGTAWADAMAMDGGHGTPADHAFMSGMADMSRHMDGIKPTGDTDKDFVAMMLPHHQGVVDMAKVELRYGKDPALRKMAADIVASQEQEIATMTAWQARNAR